LYFAASRSDLRSRQVSGRRAAYNNYLSILAFGLRSL